MTPPLQRSAAFFILSCLMTRCVLAQDWPQWRYDARRSAASPHKLPDQLQLLWQRRYSARVPAWENPLNRDKLTFDRHFEPAVKDGRMFITFNDTDKI